MSRVTPNTLSEIAEVVRVLQTGGQVKITRLRDGLPSSVHQSRGCDDGFVNLPDFSTYRYDPLPREVEVTVMIGKISGTVIAAITDRGRSLPAEDNAHRYVKGKLTYEG